MGNKLGRYDSWNLLSDTVAIKKCDKSFFEHNGSGIPNQARWFFDADDMKNGTNKQLTFKYNDREYAARINKESSESGRTRLFWSSELGELFKSQYGNDAEFPEAKFVKKGEDYFEVEIERNIQIIGTPLHDMITKWTGQYVAAKGETFAGNSLGTYVRSEIPNIIYNTGIVNTSKYLVSGSVGQGNWAMIPWVCIFDRSVTITATKGVYIVYLLSKDGNSLYISFNQGCTDIKKNHTKKETIKIMHENAELIRSQIDNRGFGQDKISLGVGLTELGELYQEGMIFYKE